MRSQVILNTFSLSNPFIVYVWTGENDAKTLRVDANFFENGEKKLRFQTNTETCITSTDDLHCGPSMLFFLTP